MKKLVEDCLTENLSLRYSIVYHLGNGTFGSVKLGTEKSTRKQVAIKILEKSRIKDQIDIERVIREI